MYEQLAVLARARLRATRLPLLAARLAVATPAVPAPVVAALLAVALALAFAVA